MKYRIPGLDTSMRHMFRIYRGIRHKETFFQIARVSSSDPIGSGELAALMGVSKSTQSHRIGSLIEQDLIQSQPDPAHRRSQIITLSDRGEVMQDELISSIKATMDVKAIVGLMERNGVTSLQIQVEEARQNHAKRGDNSDES